MFKPAGSRAYFLSRHTPFYIYCYDWRLIQFCFVSLLYEMWTKETKCAITKNKVQFSLSSDLGSSVPPKIKDEKNRIEYVISYFVSIAVEHLYQSSSAQLCGIVMIITLPRVACGNVSIWDFPSASSLQCCSSCSFFLAPAAAEDCYIRGFDLFSTLLRRLFKFKEWKKKKFPLNAPKISIINSYPFGPNDCLCTEKEGW